VNAGGALQLMSDDDEDDDEGDAGVAGLEGQEDSEEEDVSAASSSTAGSDDSDEFGEHMNTFRSMYLYCGRKHICSLTCWAHAGDGKTD